MANGQLPQDNPNSPLTLLPFAPSLCPLTHHSVARRVVVTLNSESGKTSFCETLQVWFPPESHLSEGLSTSLPCDAADARSLVCVVCGMERCVRCALRHLSIDLSPPPPASLLRRKGWHSASISKGKTRH